MTKILIIDDSAFMRNILKELLHDITTNNQINADLEIYEADGKERALEQLKHIKPDVILLDIVMTNSETEGIDFIKAIKDTFDTSKIIMITSMALSSLVEECKSHGVRIYLQKPFEQEQVIAALNQVLV